MSSITGITSGANNSDAWAQLRAARAATQNRIQNQLLSKVDADGSGSVDSSELQSALDTSAKKTGVTIDAKATDLLAQADKNGDGSLNAPELEKALQSALPPPWIMDFAPLRSAHTSSANDASYNALDTNQNGAVSASELAAGATGTTSHDPLAALFEAVDTDGDKKLSVSETDALAKQVATALETMQKASSSSTSGSGTSGDEKTFDLRTLAQLVLKQYEAMANKQSSTSTLNATA